MKCTQSYLIVFTLFLFLCRFLSLSFCLCFGFFLFLFLFVCVSVSFSFHFSFYLCFSFFPFLFTSFSMHSIRNLASFYFLFSLFWVSLFLSFYFLSAIYEFLSLFFQFVLWYANNIIRFGNCNAYSALLQTLFESIFLMTVLILIDLEYRISLYLFSLWLFWYWFILSVVFHSIFMNFFAILKFFFSKISNRKFNYDLNSFLLKAWQKYF